MSRTAENLVSDLFGYPFRPGFKTGGTSQDAAFAIAPTVESVRLRIIVVLPGTADEIAERLSLKLAYVGPRLTELTADGRAIKTTERRKSLTSKQSRAVYAKANP